MEPRDHTKVKLTHLENKLQNVFIRHINLIFLPSSVRIDDAEFNQQDFIIRRVIKGKAIWRLPCPPPSMTTQPLRAQPRSRCRGVCGCETLF